MRPSALKEDPSKYPTINSGAMGIGTKALGAETTR
jgi:hypothetical protein